MPRRFEKFVFWVCLDLFLEFVDALEFVDVFECLDFFAKVRKSESPAGRPGTASQIVKF